MKVAAPGNLALGIMLNDAFFYQNKRYQHVEFWYQIPAI